jgi:hypothetical protein
MSRVHLPSRYRHCLPGGCVSSLVGAPSRARSSVSVLPVRETCGPLDAAEAGLPSAGVAAADAWTGADVLPRTVAAGCDLDAAEGPGLVAGAVRRACEEAGVGLVRPNRSSRADRATSHPDKSNSPTPTVCVIRLLIFIPHPNSLYAPRPKAIMWQVCGAVRPKARNFVLPTPAVSWAAAGLTTRRRGGPRSSRRSTRISSHCW